MPLDPNDPGIAVQTTHGPTRLPAQIANQLLAQPVNEPIPARNAAPLGSIHPSQSSTVDTENSLSSVQQSQPAAAGSSENPSDVTATTITSGESTEKAREPSVVDARQRAALSNGVSSSASATEQSFQSLQPRVEDGEDDDN